MKKLLLILILTSCATEEYAGNWTEACRQGAGIISDRNSVYEKTVQIGGVGYSETLKSSWNANLVGLDFCAALCARKFGADTCGTYKEQEQYFTYVFENNNFSGLPDRLLKWGKADRKMIKDIRKIYDNTTSQPDYWR